MRSNYTLPRLWLDHPLSGEIDLSRDHAHYLGTVLRKREGDQVRLFNAQDGEWSADIIDVGRKSMRLRIAEQLREPTTVPDIRLLFAPIRRHRTATLIEKATELGVRTLQPVLTERTQYPKLNIERVKAQIIEAVEQTERLDLPAIHDVCELDEVLDKTRPLIFADEAGDGEAVGHVLSGLFTPVDLLIGPEGGFTDAERSKLLALKTVHPVSLGPRILRADTAAISLLTLVQAQIGDWLNISE
ncbi:MAG: 16S rRNA (uracil(1498)-N(3))-methyltransferase [Pseudomonadota bacterium]